MSDSKFVGVAGVCGVALVILIGFFWGATYESTPVDKMALHYTGGPFQGRKFVEVIPPGTQKKYYGQMEKMYLLPVTQRTYSISRDPNQGDSKTADEVLGTSKDNVPFTFEAIVYFKLNPDPLVAKRFLEQICLHDQLPGTCTNTDEGKGWDKMLALYFRPSLESAVRAETGKYDREQLWHDPVVLTSIQDSVGSTLKDRINHSVGGPYFCGSEATTSSCTNFGFILKDPRPPQGVVDAYVATAAAAQGVITAQQQAQAKVAAAKGDADAQRERAAAPPVPPGNVDYIRAQAEQACASSDRCTLIISNGGGSGVNVNAGRP